MLKLRYRNMGEVYPRRLGPLGLVLKGGVWYLVAQSGAQAASGGQKDKAIRTYKRCRHRRCRSHQRTICRGPKAFDLAAYWEKASRDYEIGTYRSEAQVRLSPKGMARLESFGAYVHERAGKTASKPDRQGWVRCSLPVESGDIGVRELMRLGDEVEILGPPELRQSMAELAGSMAARHGADTHNKSRATRVAPATDSRLNDPLSLKFGPDTARDLRVRPHARERNAQTHRYPHRPDHRCRAHRHRPGLRVRLFRRAGVQGAAAPRAIASCW